MRVMRSGVLLRGCRGALSSAGACRAYGDRGTVPVRVEGPRRENFVPGCAECPRPWAGCRARPAVMAEAGTGGPRQLVATTAALVAATMAAVVASTAR